LEIEIEIFSSIDYRLTPIGSTLFFSQKTLKTTNSSAFTQEQEEEKKNILRI